MSEPEFTNRPCPIPSCAADADAPCHSSNTFHMERLVYDPAAEPARFTVKKVFKSSKSSKVGNVYGCFVEAGTVRAGDRVWLERPDGLVAAYGTPLDTMRRFSEGVTEVRAGYEFGFTWRGPELPEGTRMVVANANYSPECAA